MIVPVIELWIEQKYLNVPASANVTLNVLPAATWPSNFPSFVGGVPLETVCVVLSLFDQVTIAPFDDEVLVHLVRQDDAEDRDEPEPSADDVNEVVERVDADRELAGRSISVRGA